MNILELEEYINEVGNCGLYQLRTQCLFALFLIPLSTQIFVQYFIMHDPPWKCVANSTTCVFNDTIVPQDHSRFRAKCNMPREEWEYTTSKDYSLVTEFDLVCLKEFYAISSTSVLFVGWAIGGIGIAYLADRIGRKRTVYASTFVVLITAIIGVVGGNVPVYFATRFITGIALGGGSVSIFVLAAELSGSKYRALTCTAIWIYYSLAMVLLTITAYLTQRWRYVQLLNSVPFLLLIFTWRYFPESIRWLCIHGRNNEAELLLATIAQVNQKPIPKATLAVNLSVEGSASILQLFYPLSIFKETLLQVSIWLCSGLTYYAVSLASHDLTGSFYSDFIFLCLIEVPANIALIFMCDRIGRKKTVISHVYLAAAACTAVAYIPLDIDDDNSGDKYLRFIAGLIGKYAASVYFNCLYIWSAELQPTIVRSQGVGFMVVMSRIGAMFAPFLITTLKNIRRDLPFLLLACANIVAGTAAFLLNETLDSQIDDTMEEKLARMKSRNERGNQ